ncbi:MAG: XTP/dITP diphosphohydrolase [Candidatus Nitrosomirales archaeon]|jgi:XTP/dITP diphosphohydrolase
MKKLYFATSNKNKFREASKILTNYGVRLYMKKLDLLEKQSDNPVMIASAKAMDAWRILHNDVIVEDDGLFIDALEGFPGPYSAFVYRTIGNEGVLKLMKNATNRRATFQSIIAYCGHGFTPKIFRGEVRGTITKTRRGRSWGYDPVFIPKHSGELTFAELKSKKNELSHRKLALEHFAEWYSKHVIMEKGPKLKSR